MNMNDNVSVILTESGAKVMNGREDYFSRIIPNYNKHEYREGDELRTQLWCLFEYFGSYVNLTCDTPFKLNEISTISKEVTGMKDMTYGEIYDEFMSRCDCEAVDYRPCCEIYDVPNIPFAIVVWLKDGGKIIYIHES